MAPKATSAANCQLNARMRATHVVDGLKGAGLKTGHYNGHIW